MVDHSTNKDFLNPTDFNLVFREIGKRLKKQREIKKLSVLDLTEISGISGSYISNIENGKRTNGSLYIYFKLAHYLDYPIETLFQDLQNLLP